MTRLLVSVRSAAEARLAVEAGVDLIDVKEPSHGSLGRAEPAVWQEVAASAGRTPLSAALGELRDWEDSIALAIPAGYSYVKLGLAGMASQAWREPWRRALEALPDTLNRVAVVYADVEAAQSPAPDALLTAARDLSCSVALVDTFVKRGRGLLSWWKLDEVAAFVDGAHERGMLAVVAGSLTAHDIARLLPLDADYVAVRGAACAGDRAAELSAPRLLELVQMVGGSAHRPIAAPTLR
ncbi:MAG: (5-formylfuran-3-yl)methyl phosphate synthase [Pirellulales bacterium]